MLFFIRCMTNIKKLSIFELLCISYNPNKFSKNITAYEDHRVNKSRAIIF